MANRRGHEYIALLERRINELAEDRAKLARRNARLASEAAEATATAEAEAAPLFVVRTEDGHALREFEHENEAVAFARRYFRRRRRHVTIDGSSWTSRSRGSVRWPRRP